MAARPNNKPPTPKRIWKKLNSNWPSAAARPKKIWPASSSPGSKTV